MPKLHALDLYCGGGGTALGLQQAGFDVVGVDVNPRHSRVYPADLIQGDALRPPVDLKKFDFIWASPPCQKFTTGLTKRIRRELHANLVAPTISMLRAAGVLYCVENVPPAKRLAPMRADVVLTGPMVGLPRIERRRIFEVNFPIPKPPVVSSTPEDWNRGYMVTITKSLCAPSHYYRRIKMGIPGRVPVREAREVMGIPPDLPMTASQVGEAVPPPYAKWIGERAMEYIMGYDYHGPHAQMVFDFRAASHV